MKFIEYDPPSGKILSFISADEQDMPAGLTNYIVVDENFEADHLSDWEVQNGVAIRTGIAQEKTAAKSLIDKRVGETRLLFITEIPGQDMTYQRKEHQARAYVAAPILAEANIIDYPFITKEALATGMTNAQVATQIVIQANGWINLGSDLEAVRIGAKISLDAATNSTEITTAISNFETEIAILLAAQ